MVPLSGTNQGAERARAAVLRDGGGTEGWDVNQLERQIHTLLFARLLKSRDKAGVLDLASRGHRVESPVDSLRDPYVLDFLSLPEHNRLRESDLEAAIIGKLQSFLLELGKGFAFVARQKRLTYEDEFFVNLVFYNCILKCYLLIDLKLGKLTHQDVGQMDSYVRLFDQKYTTEGDNPHHRSDSLRRKKRGGRALLCPARKQAAVCGEVPGLYAEPKSCRRELRRERLILEEHTPSSGSTL